MSETIIISLTPSDIFPVKHLNHSEVLTIDKKYQLCVVNIDPLRSRGVRYSQGKDFISLVFGFL